MGKKSFFDKIVGKSAPEAIAAAVPAESGIDSRELEGEVDHLWMKEDIDAKKPSLKKDPRVDTGILRNRIADKIAKMNNH
ncbi:MAG: hypothetical protein GKR92_02235 [Gammaproteobacteria bacterium]|nr:MAG: hypothetical protein GKR92_02235 [Gammaproteobacteria bacterium]